MSLFYDRLTQPWHISKALVKRYLSVQVIFDKGPRGKHTTFESPKESTPAQSGQSALNALKVADDRLKQGNWIAGYLSYKLGYVFTPRLHPLL